MNPKLSQRRFLIPRAQRLKDGAISFTKKGGTRLASPRRPPFVDMGLIRG